VASKWKAILLLNEADVYFQRRDDYNLKRNRLVAIFLRMLEYYNGMLFLTTNKMSNIDAAILDRVHLKVEYNNLPASARVGIFQSSLHMLNASINKSELEIFAQIDLNGQEVRWLSAARLFMLTGSPFRFET
jgi:SpoVK/Ycf46/Vps4 family AAA+-type ATPase